MSSISRELEKGSPHHIFQHNIKNSMYHVIRDHRRCSQDFCTYERTESAELPWPDDSTKEIQVCENKNFHLLAEHICLLRWPSSIIFLEHTPTHVSWFIVIEVPMGVINLMSFSSDRNLIFLLPIFLNLVWGNALEDVRLHYAPFLLIQTILERMAALPSIELNGNSNLGESYMNTRTHTDGGKMADRGKRRSWNSHCYGKTRRHVVPVPVVGAKYNFTNYPMLVKTLTHRFLLDNWSCQLHTHIEI